MLFNSYVFIFLFFPITITGYFFLNNINKFKLSQYWLLICSLFFYGYFNFSYIVLIIFSIIFNYCMTLLLYKDYEKKIRKLIVVIAISINVGIFMYFKYYDFFVQNINSVFSTSFTLKHILLPLGISFFTFQQIGYVVDCYRKEMDQYPFVYYASFVAFFPQLIAGPIVSHNEIIPQFLNESKKKIDFDNLSKGLLAFAIGFAKKVLIADVFGKAVDVGYWNIDGLNSVSALLVIFSYSIQIYFDFSGYCDMATGLGLMMNIELPQNFNSPYKAISVPDFWSRWHITLTRFFKKYVYFPLGGNRVGKFRTKLNMLIVFIISGFWHGANWTFIFWGLLHGLANIISKSIQRFTTKVPKVLKWFVTFAFVSLAWVYFRAPDLETANKLLMQITNIDTHNILSQLFVPFYPDFVKGTVKLIPSLQQYSTMINKIFLYFYVSLAAILVIFTNNTNKIIQNFKPRVIISIAICIIFVLSTISLSGVEIFLYFNF